MQLLAGDRLNCPLCSQSPHDKKGLDGHPHWSCAPGTRTIRMCSFDGRSGTNMGPRPKRGKASKLGRINWMGEGRSTRAVEITTAASLNAGEELGPTLFDDPQRPTWVLSHERNRGEEDWPGDSLYSRTLETTRLPLPTRRRRGNQAQLTL
jgi:hypothetical protein